MRAEQLPAIFADMVMSSTRQHTAVPRRNMRAFGLVVIVPLMLAVLAFMARAAQRNLEPAARDVSARQITE
jgi:hypothetical protein